MSEPALTLHRWTRAEYERIVDAGVFDPEARLELLDGEIVEMSPQKSLHAAAVDLVEDVLRRCLGAGYYVRGQKPLALDDISEPEPDVAVVKGSIRDYTGQHPTTAVLLVEVADTTLTKDRQYKATVYARNGIPEYWILNLRDRALEVYRYPTGNAYSKRLVLSPDQTVAPLVVPDMQIKVADLLP